MARKSDSSIVQEELYPLPAPPAREEIDDARLRDLDVEQESPFLRGQKRVPVRRGSLPKKTASRISWVIAVVCVLLLCGAAYATLYNYGKHSWRFRINSSDDIEIAGLQNVTHSQIMEVLGGDIGRNIFFVPLSERKTQLEQIPWVENASVMRFVPNRLRVEIRERMPVAFARIGSKIMLIDAGGNLMELPASSKTKYSFPVILGASAGEPLSTRAPRMKIYNDLIGELDSGGASYSHDLSEVDLSDPDDVKVLASDPQGAVLVHLGSSNYLDRYKIYVSHLQEWRQQFDKLESVDLRYDRQIVVNPDLRGMEKPAPLTISAVKTASAAGVKPAALVTHSKAYGPPAPTKPPAKTIGPMKTAKALVSKSPAKAVATKKWAPKKKTVVKAQTKPKPHVVPAASQTKLPAIPARPAAASSSSKKPSPSIRNQEQ
ncbi:MAG TPA: FtsQ-type POTRA domain-containing protein [Terriglobales bacterium]